MPRSGVPFDIRKLDATSLNKLNTATKYNSIETYHKLGDRGIPGGDVRHSFAGKHKPVVTEKIDGANFRVIALPDGSKVIGNRNSLLTVIGDIVHNPAEGIVDTVKEWASKLPTPPDEQARVYFGEVFGGSIGQNAKQYTAAKTMTGFRIFDVADIKWIWHVVHNWELEDVSDAREAGTLQEFLREFELSIHVDQVNAETTRRLAFTSAPPTDAVEVYPWLEEVIPTTWALLDPSGGGKPEGVVVRTPDRSHILKIRYEDYGKLMKSLGHPVRG